MKKYLPHILIIVALLSLAGLLYSISTPKEVQATFNGYTYQRSLTVTSQASSTQTSMPVLVCINSTPGVGSCLSAPDLKASSSGGSIMTLNASSTPNDLVFSTSSVASGLLPFEIEKYSSSTGETIAWVNMPTVAAGQVLYMYYGRSGDTNHQNATGVYDSSYQEVYHFPNGSSLSVFDSTGANNGTNVGATATTGNIDGAAAFNGSTQYVSVPSPSTASGKYTISAWINVSSALSFGTIIKNWGDSGASAAGAYHFGLGDTDGKISNYLNQSNLSTVGPIEDSLVLSTGTWYYYVSTADGSFLRLFRNGNSVATPLSYDGTINPFGFTDIGAKPSNASHTPPGTSGGWWNGNLDEVRVSNVARSSSWILTEYNNQANNSTFWTMSGASTGATVSVVSFQNAVVSFPGTNGYSYGIPFTITSQASSTQTDFPVLFSSTISDLKTVVNGGKVQSATGQDIIFTSDQAGNLILPFEIETYASTTGQLVAWFKGSTVTNGSKFYMFFGQSGAPSRSNPTGVYTNGFAAVYHLPNGLILSTADSITGATSTNTNGVTATTGQIDGAGAFAAASLQTIASASAPVATFPLTISAWFKPTSGSQNGVMAALTGDSNGHGRKDLGMGSGNLFLFSEDDGSTGLFYQGTAPISSGVWQYGVAVFASATDYRLYLNAGNKTTNSSSVAYGTVTNAVIGSDNQAGNYFDGGIDEVRYSNVARSDSWITTEYNNQSSPGTFYTLGTEFMQTAAVVAFPGN